MRLGLEDDHGKVHHTLPTNITRRKIKIYGEQGTFPIVYLYFFQNCKEEKIYWSKKKADLCLSPACGVQKSHHP